jgi:hypothetical protein
MFILAAVVFDSTHCKISPSVHFLMSKQILLLRHFHIAGATSIREEDNETP